MQRGVILLNGEPYSGKIEDENAFVVCCDGLPAVIFLTSAR